jgi:hypothetical protein
MPGMARVFGPLLLLALVLLWGGIRMAESARADTLLDNQARAAVTVAQLQAACQDLTAGGAHAGLARDAAASVAGLAALEPPDPERVFLSDGNYCYGLISSTSREPGSGRVVQGWCLRAWPAKFGVTGQREFQIGDDGVLWEGQNRYARSGTERGYPPPFPDPDIGQPHAAWWQVRLPAHR